jgi:hypothetical protein
LAISRFKKAKLSKGENVKRQILVSPGSDYLKDFIMLLILFWTEKGLEE